MENYLFEIFLYFPIAVFIFSFIMSKYIFKEKGITIRDILGNLLICFIPIINIIIPFGWILHELFYTKWKVFLNKLNIFLNKKLW